MSVLCVYVLMHTDSGFSPQKSVLKMTEPLKNVNTKKYIFVLNSWSTIFLYRLFLQVLGPYSLNFFEVCAYGDKRFLT